MPHRLTARYRDAAGHEHHLRVERTPRGFWRVLDVGPDGERLVEELGCHDDQRPQAEALARDYAEQAASPPEASATTTTTTSPGPPEREANAHAARTQHRAREERTDAPPRPRARHPRRPRRRAPAGVPRHPP